jgi:hypothetical protein
MSKRCGKIWEEFRCNKKVYFRTKKNMENIWTTGVIIEPERRNILEINYEKLRKVIKGSYRGFNFNLLKFFFEIQNKIMVFCCSKYTKTIGNLVKVPSKYIELGGYLIPKKDKLVCATYLVEIKA